MRAVVQRVSHAKVTIDDHSAGRKLTTGEIHHGLLVLLGVEQSDQTRDAEYLANKVIGLRVFEDDQGKMNRSVQDLGGGILVVSQFTLLGDVRKGKRPSFVNAADPTTGKQLYEAFVELIRAAGIETATGQFQTSMSVELTNEGPVTILLDSHKQF